MKIREILNNYMSGYFHHENTSNIKVGVGERVGWLLSLEESVELPVGEYIVWYSKIYRYADDELAVTPEYTFKDVFGNELYLVRIEE